MVGDSLCFLCFLARGPLPGYPDGDYFNIWPSESSLALPTTLKHLLVVDISGFAISQCGFKLSDAPVGIFLDFAKER